MLGLSGIGAAQVKAGETSLNLNGTVSGGYTADYSNYASSDHAFTVGGDASLQGSYYNPNFLSFSIQPFYGQSRANSNFQSISAASGVSAGANIFSGSDFPGSISYTRSFNSSGNYAIPGAGDLVTHGDSGTFSANWGIHRDGYPRVAIGFLDSNSSSTLYGTDQADESHSKTFRANSVYQLLGFALSGGYQHTASNSQFPDLFGQTGTLNTDSSSNSYSLGIGHKLPLQGSFAASANRSDVSTNSEGLQYNTKVDSLSSSVSFAPAQNFSAGSTATYIDNLDGFLYTSLTPSGLLPPQDLLGQTSASHGLSLGSFANYDLPALHVHLRGFQEHQQQSLFGVIFTSDSANGNVDYSNGLFGGQLTADFGVGYTFVNISNHSSVGLNSSMSYQKAILRWDVKGSFSYYENTQTLLAAYTSSGYNYTGSVGRHFFGKNYWSMSASGTRSLLTDQPGSANSSQSYSTSLNIRKFGISANYSKSDGNALLASTGLVATPVPVPVLNPAAVVVFKGTSYGFGLGASPVRGLTISGSFAKALSDTASAVNWSSNNNETINVLVLYQLRKLNFTAGYLKLNQGFYPSTTPATMVGSFYVGISRWFNFF